MILLFQKLIKQIAVILLLIFINNVNLFSETEKVGISIDTVISFIPGTGQNIGQGKEYFPNNIFGLPSRTANDRTPESSSEQILSLGLGGEIIVSFNNYEIVDGVGSDFVIFENAFINPATKKMFIEPAEISVSQDGVNYYTFPYSKYDFKGCAGITPTYGNKNPFDFPEGGGDGFDIGILGLTKIKYIRIKDITSQIIENPDNYYFDPTLSGFDLDAVLGLHYKKDGETAVVTSNVQDKIIKDISFTEFEVSFSIYKSEKVEDIQRIRKIEIVDLLGNIIFSQDYSSHFDREQSIFYHSNYLPHTLILRVITANNTFIKKLVR